LQKTKAESPSKVAGKELLTLEEAAEFIRIQPAAMAYLSEQKRFPAIQVMGVTRFRMADLVEWCNIRVNKRLKERLR
jgi:hypothetical protein